MKHTISRETVAHISESKNEPSWMKELRLSALNSFERLAEKGMGPVDFAQVRAFLDRPESSIPSSQWPTDLTSVVEERGDEEGLIVQRDSTTLSRSITKDMTKKGVVYTDLDMALKLRPDLVEKYFAQQLKPDDCYTALNTAFWSGGSFLYVPPHVEVPLPFHSCYWMTTPVAAIFPRTVIVADRGSRVSLVDDFLSVDWDKTALAVSAVEIYLHEGARVSYKQIHHWGKGVHHENRQMSSVAAAGKLDCSQMSDPRPVMTLEHAAELYPEVRL